MTHVSIIGKGAMSTAVAKLVTDGGNTVEPLGREDADRAPAGDVVRAGGLNAIDAGSLRRARELEAIGFLEITLAAGDKVPWTGGFGVAA